MPSAVLPAMPDYIIKTPCVGLCSTVYGDLVCRGCKRFHHEVIHWNGYNEDEKRAVWLRLEQLLVQVMTAKLEVFDVDKLRMQLTQRKIRFVPHQSEYCWAYQLIARGARVISQVEAYGFVLLSEFRDWTLPELRDAIDREFFLLSEAHYQRYIAPGFLRDAFGA
ncbi:putative Fe-S protein [Pseudomonas coronafaciens pv. atropurpurea]|nr:putative Fe-S protein [Pseudomonas coronafaciens pv. atropurpurea]